MLKMIIVIISLVNLGEEFIMDLSFNQVLDFFSKSDLQYLKIFSTTLSVDQQDID